MFFSVRLYYMSCQYLFFNMGQELQKFSAIPLPLKAMPMLRRVRPRTSGGEDRLSALHDDLILLIVSRLDTRRALSMAILARRWVRIPHKLSALDFRVSDILPPEYERTVALRQRNLPRDATLAGTLDGLNARCEIDTIRSFANGITSFLEADSGHDRHVKTLRLEFFQTYNSICVDRLINVAIGTWGWKIWRLSSGHRL